MMTRDLLASKFKAFTIHFGISFAIFLVLLYFVIFHWYPLPFFSTDGGWQGIRLIAAIDLVLGPTLTFIVFNSSKSRRHLTMDLSLIGICQIAALAWGTWAVHNERPYLAVFADGTFSPLAYYQTVETGLTKEALRKFSSTTPIKIYVDVPTDNDEYMRLLVKSAGSQPLHFMGDRYHAFDKSQLDNITHWNIDMEAYLKGEPAEWNHAYQQFTQSLSGKLENMLFFGLNARYGKHIIVIDKSTMEFVKVLDIPPPEIDEIIWGKEKAKERRQQNKATTSKTQANE
ncbi:MAG: hypothetical protein OQK73_03380 [Gammaproteobacteria bacterium]|nr:hypothetical protein [Gammaproteobacteria bacterium]